MLYFSHSKSGSVSIIIQSVRVFFIVFFLNQFVILSDGLSWLYECVFLIVESRRYTVQSVYYGHPAVADYRKDLTMT